MEPGRIAAARHERQSVQGVYALGTVGVTQASSLTTVDMQRPAAVCEVLHYKKCVRAYGVGSLSLPPHVADAAAWSPLRTASPSPPLSAASFRQPRQVAEGGSKLEWLPPAACAASFRLPRQAVAEVVGCRLRSRWMSGCSKGKWLPPAAAGWWWVGRRTRGRSAERG
eukprot:9480997-Pyramimonas_sp.AAC.2